LLTLASILSSVGLSHFPVIQSGNKHSIFLDYLANCKREIEIFDFDIAKVALHSDPLVHLTVQMASHSGGKIFHATLCRTLTVRAAQVLHQRCAAKEKMAGSLLNLQPQNA